MVTKVFFLLGSVTSTQIGLNRDTGFNFGFGFKLNLGLIIVPINSGKQPHETKKNTTIFYFNAT